MSHRAVWTRLICLGVAGTVTSRSSIICFTAPTGFTAMVQLWFLSLWKPPWRLRSASWPTGFCHQQKLQLDSERHGRSLTEVTQPSPIRYGRLNSTLVFGRLRYATFLAEPFANYNFGAGWSVSSAPIIADDETHAGREMGGAGRRGRGPDHQARGQAASQIVVRRLLQRRDPAVWRKVATAIRARHDLWMSAGDSTGGKNSGFWRPGLGGMSS